MECIDDNNFKIQVRVFKMDENMMSALITCSSLKRLLWLITCARGSVSNPSLVSLPFFKKTSIQLAAAHVSDVSAYFASEAVN